MESHPAEHRASGWTVTVLQRQIQPADKRVDGDPAWPTRQNACLD